MTFHVGQPVAVHDDRAGYAYGDLFPFTKGQVVTVEQLGPMDCVKVSGDYRFWANERFRPLVERKTSIELFHQIRRDVENNVPAELETPGAHTHDCPINAALQPLKKEGE